MRTLAPQTMMDDDAAPPFEDEMLESEAEEQGDASSDVIEVGEQFVDAEPQQDESIYQDFGPGGDVPSAGYYGGGGGGGGGGYQQPYQQPLPAATVAPTACPDGLPPTSYDPTTGQPLCTRTVTPVTPLPAKTPREVKNFVDKVRSGVALTPGDVKRAADAAKNAGMPAAAGKIVQIGNRVMTTRPVGGGGGQPGPVAPVPQTGKGPSPTPSSSKGGSRLMPTRRSSSKWPVPPRRLRGLEENMSGIGSFDISEVGVDGCGVGCDLGDVGDLGDAAEDFLYGGGQDIYAPGPFSEEGQIPGYEMDEYGGGDYAPQESYAEPMYEEPQEYAQPQQYAPSYPSYGPAPQQYQQQYGQDPYGGQYVPQGYDPYAMQQGYPSPYGYQQPSPYGQQQGYGCQPDPYTGQMPAMDPYTGQPCAGAASGTAAGMFPAGTPQIIIDTATAIMSGTATLQMVQQAVSTATSMGYAAVANQLIAMYTQYGGQYEAGAATGGRYCKAGEDPAVSGCIAKTAVGTYSWGPLPTDAESCKAEAETIRNSKQFKAAIAATAAKKPMTAEQKAYFLRYTQLAKCGGFSWQKGVTGTELSSQGTLTADQKARGCVIKRQGGRTFVSCPSATGGKPSDYGTQTKRGLARTAYGSIYANLIRYCKLYGKKDKKGTPICKGGIYLEWGNRATAAKSLPETPVTQATYDTVMAAAKGLFVNGQYQTSYSAGYKAFQAAATAAGIWI